MVISIRSIETAIPPTSLQQAQIRDIFASQPGLTRLSTRLVNAAFDASAIETRHTVLNELDGRAHPGPARFYDHKTGEIGSPLTGARNDVYIERAPELFSLAARRALDAADGIGPDDVTHVVTVSCTGFFAPGPEYRIVRDLGLRTSTQRYHLGFMGCFAALPALRAAQAFCVADPNAVVLVVCAELCSLHLTSSNNPDAIVASSVFADGAAAAVVTARPAPAGARVLDLDAFETVLTDVGEEDMAWSIGDHGFDMVLSRYVPHIIAENIKDALAPLLVQTRAQKQTQSASNDSKHSAIKHSAIKHWAIHPGGRAILDTVQEALELNDSQLVPSRTTLREFGNMSSATVLFVLRRILHGLDDPTTPGDRVCAMAFGPGLTVESALLTWRLA